MPDPIPLAPDPPIDQPIILLRSRDNRSAKIYMNCEACGAARATVTNTTPFNQWGFTGVARVYACRNCDHKFRTAELSPAGFRRLSHVLTLIRSAKDVRRYAAAMIAELKKVVDT
jgi:hypothetical protein